VGRVGLAVLILGIAGIVVPLMFNLHLWLIAVLLLSLLLVVVAEGSYGVWHETDQQRKVATAESRVAPLPPRCDQTPPYLRPMTSWAST
jgi:hypothetical protein